MQVAWGAMRGPPAGLYGTAAGPDDGRKWWHGLGPARPAPRAARAPGSPPAHLVNLGRHLLFAEQLPDHDITGGGRRAAGRGVVGRGGAGWGCMAPAGAGRDAHACMQPPAWCGRAATQRPHPLASKKSLSAWLTWKPAGVGRLTSADCCCGRVAATPLGAARGGAAAARGVIGGIGLPVATAPAASLPPGDERWAAMAAGIRVGGRVADR